MSTKDPKVRYAPKSRPPIVGKSIVPLDGSRTITDGKLGGRLLWDVSGAGLTFVRCTFDYAIFENCYFRSATFENCTFVGCRFSRCNLRSIKLNGKNDFRYCQFDQTWIPSKQISNHLPLELSPRQLLCQVLRANYESMGMHKAADHFFLIDMDVTGDHKSEKAKGLDPWYREKYPEHLIWGRLKYKLAFYGHNLSSALWGHGASPARLATTLISPLVLTSLFLSMEPTSFGAPEADWLTSLGAAGFFVTTAFLGVSYELAPQTKLLGFVTAIISAWGYVGLGLGIAVVYRRLARR